MGALSTRLFEVKHEMRVDDLVSKLKRAREHTEIFDNPATGEEIILKTTIEDVEKIENQKVVRGTMVYDSPIPIKQRGETTQYIITTIPVRFSFIFGSMYFVVHDRSVADATADKMAKTVMRDVTNPILKCRISPDNLQDFLDGHNHVLTHSSVGDVTIPNFSGSQFQGTGFDRRPEYRVFRDHGILKGFRINLVRQGWSISMNRDACVTFFSNVTENQMEDFMRSEIIPICD